MKICVKMIMVFILLFEGIFYKIKTYEFVEEPEIRVSSCIVSVGDELKECWFEADIYGSIKNITDENWVRVVIVFTVFDEDGKEVGEATAEMRNVEAGEIWAFCAILQESPLTKPATFSLKEVKISDYFIADYPLNSNEIFI